MILKLVILVLTGNVNIQKKTLTVMGTVLLMLIVMVNVVVVM